MAGSLSGGEQQMVAMARALIGRPRLLMIDEPSLGLSPVLVEELYDRLRLLNEAEGLTVLLVEQYVDLALGAAGHAYVLEKGQIVLQGPAPELHRHPEVVSAYVLGRFREPQEQVEELIERACEEVERVVLGESQPD